MTESQADNAKGGLSGRPFAWDRGKEDERLPGSVLAALRRGWNAEPGSVPAMWRFYTQLNDIGSVTRRLRAEHLALSLFGAHQQSESRTMHWKGVLLGQALGALRRSDRFSTDAVDRRVAQVASADDVTEFAHHLRGLISMLKSLPEPQGLDYTLLYEDLVRWQSPDSRSRVRRRLGSDYFRTNKQTDPSTKGS